MNVTSKNDRFELNPKPQPTRRCAPALALALALLSLGSFPGLCLGVRAAEVTTDQLDYPPGATAYISGSGFDAGETVTLQVVHADGTPDTGEDHQPWNVVANADGAFTTTWHVCEDDCLGSTLRLTATGQSSGLSAEAFFTDAFSGIRMGPVIPLFGACARRTNATPDYWLLRPGQQYRLQFALTSFATLPACFATEPPSIAMSLGPTFGNLTFTAVRSGISTLYTNTITIPPGACGETTISYSCDDGSVLQVLSQFLSATSPPVHVVASSDCTNSITCPDQQFPTIDCPDNVVANASSTSCSAVVFYPPPLAFGSPPPTVTCAPPSGSTFAKGTTTVSCTAVNSEGSASCSFTVTVIDNTPPTLHCPAATFSDHFDSGLPAGTSVSGNANTRVADDGTGNNVVHLTDDGQVGANGYFFIPDTASGTLVRELTVRWRSLLGGINQPGELIQFGQGGADGYSFNWGTDVASTGFQGEEGTGTGLTVTVDTFDNGAVEAPGIEIKYGGTRVAFDPISPGNQTAAKAFLRKNQFVDAVLTVDDTGHVTFTYDGRTTTATLAGWSGIAGGNFVFGARTGAAHDNQWIDDLHIESNPIVITGDCSGSVSFAASATDNCGVASVVYKVGEIPITSPHVFPAGSTTVDVIATDVNGNAAACSFMVTVTGSGSGGGEPLVLTCPPDLAVQCDAEVPPPDPASVTVSGQNGLLVTHVGDESAGSNPRIIHRTYQATDACGNSGSCVQTIVVDDTTPPSFPAGCGGFIVQPNDPGQCGAVVTYPTPMAADNCGTANVTCSPEPGTLFPVGTTTVHCTAIDPSGNHTECSFSVTINDTEPPNVTACPNELETAAGANCRAAIPDVTAGVAAEDNCTPAALLTITQSPAAGTEVELGVYEITVTVTDAAGKSSPCTALFTVFNSAPAIASLTGPTDPLPLGSAATIVAEFTDGDLLQTHTCHFDWDDGSSDTVALAAGITTASQTHTYATAGVYTVTATVSDPCASASKTFEFVVIYDPAAGFVTGGGWIDSPAGALVSNPVLTGKANFGFVSKYQKGATVPTGQTEFQFKAGDLNFHSTVYQWLVVSGAKAQYKGNGTINGAGSYNFLLTATDGQLSGGGGVDKFRIKIWTVDELIYDNVMGASDDIKTANPQAISGGSIVIHK